MKAKSLTFKIEKRLKKPDGTFALGRAGVIKTAHGDIKTPAFMCVGTKGEVRFVSTDDLKKISAQAMLSNGYHLRRKSKEIAHAGGLSSWSKWNGPTLTDSGGFQVMSLGSGLGKVVSMEREKGVTNTAHKERLAKITELGVSFKDPFDKKHDFIGPEQSMKIQCRIGADIHMAFDELTSLADTYKYNIKAMKRTERWAKRSLKSHVKHRDELNYRQNLYGVLQGGRWEDLRRSTAKKIGSMQYKGVSFDGFGLGGAFLKEDLGKILTWCNEELPENKPKHLLGLSHPDDIFVGAENGADTFDCVAPTREARHGKIYSTYGDINLRKCTKENYQQILKEKGKTYADRYISPDKKLDIHCDCPVCKAGYTRGDLRELWKSGDPNKKKEYYNLASIHNLRFIIRLTENIRKSIIDGTFYQFKEQFLKKYYQNK